MKPVQFKGHNAVLAKDQPQYLPLPVCHECTPERSVVSCWKPSILERIKILFGRKIYFRQSTFGGALQPIRPMLDWKPPNCLNCGQSIGDHKVEQHFLCPSKLN